MVMLQKIILIISSFPLFFLSLDAQTAKSEKVTYEKNPSRINIITYSFPSTAPKEYKDYINLPEPKIEDLSLKFPGATPSSYEGPDGGHIDFWRPGLYRWMRSDGSIFQEWESGNWQIQIPNKITVDVFKEACVGCKPTIRFQWEDGTEINKMWIAHRRDYTVVFQNEKYVPALNWLLPDPAKFPSNRKTIGPYEFYYSDYWNFYLKGLQDSFSVQAFNHELAREYGMSNKGKIPVLLFDKSSEVVAYNGRELPGSSAEGGFGGQDSIQLCCGEKLKQSTGNAEVDLDTQMRTYFGTFYHEAVHNMHQIACLTKRAGKENLPLANQSDPWFVEGFANHVAATLYPQKRAEIYEQLYKRMSENKLPKDFDSMQKEGYRDLLPYYLGAYMVEYLHREYGKESVQKYIHITSLGESTKPAIKQVTGKEAGQFYADSIADFKVVYPKSGNLIKHWRFGHLTKIHPLHEREFELFQRNRISLPRDVREIKSMDQIPNLQNIFEAEVSSYAGEVEGDFYGTTGERFYLWKQGNYKWYDDDYELFFTPDSFILLKYKGWQVVQWANGQRKMIAPDGTSAMFWSAEQKAYLDKEGKPLQ
jgi:hypothetical protein